MSWCCGNCINCRHLLLSTPGRSLSALFSLPFRIFFMAIDQFNNSFLGQRSADVHQLLPSRGVMEMEVGEWESGKVGLWKSPASTDAPLQAFPFVPFIFPQLFFCFVLAFVSDERFFPYGCVAMCPRNLFLLSAMCELLSAICCKFKVLKRLRQCAREGEGMSSGRRSGTK